MKISILCLLALFASLPAQSQTPLPKQPDELKYTYKTLGANCSPSAFASEGECDTSCALQGIKYNHDHKTTPTTQVKYGCSKKLADKMWYCMSQNCKILSTATRCPTPDEMMAEDEEDCKEKMHFNNKTIDYRDLFSTSHFTCRQDAGHWVADLKETNPKSGCVVRFVSIRGNNSNTHPENASEVKGSQPAK